MLFIKHKEYTNMKLLPIYSIRKKDKIDEFDLVVILWLTPFCLFNLYSSNDE